MLNKNYLSYLPVICGIILKRDFVLVAQRSAKMQLPLKWEFPGGKIDTGETEIAALRRELFEELSIQVETGERLPVVDHPQGERLLQLVPYICYYDGQQPIIPTEHAQIKWLTRAGLSQLDWAEADITLALYVQEHWDRLQATRPTDRI